MLEFRLPCIGMMFESGDIPRARLPLLSGVLPRLAHRWGSWGWFSCIAVFLLDLSGHIIIQLLSSEHNIFA